MPKGFKIVKKLFSKSDDVFGIRIFATENVEQKRFLHASNVLREYLDSDGDGRADSKKLVRSLRKEKACMTLFEDESELDFFLDNHERTLEKTGLQFQDLLMMRLFFLLISLQDLMHPLKRSFIWYPIMGILK